MLEEEQQFKGPGAGAWRGWSQRASLAGQGVGERIERQIMPGLLAP